MAHSRLGSWAPALNTVGCLVAVAVVVRRRGKRHTPRCEIDIHRIGQCRLLARDTLDWNRCSCHVALWHALLLCVLIYFLSLQVVAGMEVTPEQQAAKMAGSGWGSLRPQGP